MEWKERAGEWFLFHGSKVVGSVCRATYPEVVYRGWIYTKCLRHIGFKSVDEAKAWVLKGAGSDGKKA